MHDTLNFYYIIIIIVIIIIILDTRTIHDIAKTYKQ